MTTPPGQEKHNNQRLSQHHRESDTKSLPPRKAHEPIAIVGIGLRFPGGADSTESYWNLLCNGVDAIVDVPPDRWDSLKFYDADPAAAGKMYVKQGGFLKASIDGFDPQFFGISPKEADHLDPQQRLLLEVSWEALEDAGIAKENLSGSNTGVFIGGFTLDSKIMQTTPANRALIDPHTANGIMMTMLANRLSYFYDFHGPSLTVDTACSSSLTALHLACQSIWNGECQAALAGGVNVMFKPEFPIAMCKGGFLSPDSRCKAFDASANGYARGEGAGILVLKPLHQALADQDKIHACIRGTAVNQDGKTNGISMPNQRVQVELVQKACQHAGIKPSQIQYMEAHGTGTQAGDPVEFGALSETVGRGRSPGSECLLGSVKTNIGHLEAASGVAGLIKAALCLKHKTIPPHLHLKNPNPKIQFEGSGLRIPTELEPWPEGQEMAFAGVNSFGYGGANAYAILQEAPALVPEKKALEESDAPTEVQEQNQNQPLLIPLSARCDESLKALALRYLDRIEAGAYAGHSLQELARGAALRRDHHECRLAVVACSWSEFKDKLESFCAGVPTQGLVQEHVLPSKSRRCVFVYTGMGPQWWSMGRGLLNDFPVFRDVVREACDVFERQAGWSLWNEWMADEADSHMSQTQIAQPTNFILQLGLTALWRTWGVQPDAVVGHSVGEVAAAYACGALTLEEAIQVSFHRSRLQKTLAGTGAMLAVGLSEERLQPLLEGVEGVCMAAHNGPQTITLAGHRAPLKQLAQELKRQNIFHRFLDVEVPYHSPQMDGIKDELIETLDSVRPQTPCLPCYSTVGAGLVEGKEHGADYWWRNVREPVRFAGAMEKMVADGYQFFVEVGPHAVLSNSIRECLKEFQGQGRLLHSLNLKVPQEAISMMENLGSWYVAGGRVEWTALIGEGSGERWAPPPKYPWHHEHYWVESSASRMDRIGEDRHPFLVDQTDDPQDSFGCELGRTAFPYLPDHRVQGNVVFPGAAFVECGLALGTQLQAKETIAIENVSFEQALFWEPPQSVRLKTRYDQGGQLFTVWSQAITEPPAPWKRHASGRLSLTPFEYPEEPMCLEDIRRRCESSIDAKDFYEQLKTMGLEYGPHFRGVRSLLQGHDEVLAEIHIPGSEKTNASKYLVHPSLLDAGFQALIGALGGSEADAPVGPYLPISIKRIRLHRKVSEEAWCHGRIRSRDSEGIIGDLTICDQEGRVCLELVGLFCKALPGPSKAAVGKGLLYKDRWEKMSVSSASESQVAPTGSWLVFGAVDGMGGALVKALKRQGRDALLVEKDRVPSRKGAGEEGRANGSSWSSYRTLLRGIDRSALQGLVYCWGCDYPAAEEASEKSMSLVRLVRWLQRGPFSKDFTLSMLTQQAHDIKADDNGQNLKDPVTKIEVEVEAGVNPVQMALWSLGRVVMSEYPAFRSRLIDLEASASEVQIKNIVHELLGAPSDGMEREVALRDEQRYVLRLDRADGKKEDAKPELAQVKADGKTPFRLELSKAGSFEHLYFEEAERRLPGVGEVEIEVRAVPLNYKDMLKAMGILPDMVLNGTYWGKSLGMELSGVVSAVGEGLEELQCGDEVIAASTNCFSSYVMAKADHVILKPEGLSFEEAPLVPLLTAVLCLKKVASLKKGERVLIHSATGGVGLLAVQVAQQIGAEIFATAGNPEKRAYLRSLGLQHVMNSRTLDFADQIMEKTEGKGVDVVLNSLSGEAQQKSLSVLAAYGRFVEIGKRDIFENRGLRQEDFNRNLTFSSFDLDRLLMEHPNVCREAALEALQGFKNGSLKPLPVTVYPCAEVAEAFSYLAKAKHIGRVVISFKKDQNVPVASKPRVPFEMKSHATYLITGGLGGFGLEVARGLIAEGARHLVLVGRRGLKTPDARKTVTELSRNGVEIEVVAADVSQADDIKSVLAQIDKQMPPLKGIFHAAMVLEDAPLSELSAQQFEKVWAPKAKGAWHLHQLTLTCKLDCFVLFSSVSSIIGNSGQGNYVAANGFLDGLAHLRQAQGLPALSVNWGALSEVGVLARDQRVMEHLGRQGIHALNPREAMSVLLQLLKQESNDPQMGVMDLDWARIAKAIPVISEMPRFSQLIRGTAGASGEATGKSTFIREMEALSPKDRLVQMETRIAEMVGATLRLPVEKVERHKPLSELGVDSLMGVELQMRILDTLGLEVTTMDLVQGPSVSELSCQLMGKLVGLSESPQSGSLRKQEDSANTLESIPEPELEKVFRNV